MNALSAKYPVAVIAFASPVYWSDETRRTAAAGEVAAAFSLLPNPPSEVKLIDSAAAAAQLAEEMSGRALIMVPLSGGVQPWMLTVSERAGAVGVAAIYLNAWDQHELSHTSMHLNAHPASTDVFAALRMKGRNPAWIDSREVAGTWAWAWQAVQRLRSSRLLRIGETEPWVINSLRDPAVWRERIGIDIRSLERPALYAAMKQADPARVRELAADWTGQAAELSEVGASDVQRACEVAAGMERLLDEQEADGLAMACFAMIGEADTTSCLGLSTLNTIAARVGGCEGDLDATVTLLLLRALEANFVWIANPVVRLEEKCVDLSHCTAPRCVGAKPLKYRLLRHHESGRGVSPEVQLPAAQTVTLVRIGAGATELAAHVGRTRRVPKQPMCHTQVRVKLDHPEQVLEHLTGTHFVLAYGDHRAALRYAASFLGLKYLPA